MDENKLSQHDLYMLLNTCRERLWLPRADLSGRFLFAADLAQANLNSANLNGANLRYSSLEGANLRKANLSEADLTGADLRAADLREADLSGTDLRRAKYNRNTKWPDGFDLKAAEVILEK